MWDGLSELGPQDVNEDRVICTGLDTIMSLAGMDSSFK
jgi:hypothetical protein